MIRRFGLHVAVHLVFDIKKFGRIEPYSGVIKCRLAANTVRNGFTHHTPRVPNRFDGAAPGWWISHLRAVADGIYAGQGALSIEVREDDTALRALLAKTILTITHESGLVDIADRVYRLESGRAVRQSP